MWSRALKVQLSITIISNAAPLRESEKNSEELYEDLPLFLIEKKFGDTEGGRSLVLITCSGIP